MFMCLKVDMYMFVCMYIICMYMNNNIIKLSIHRTVQNCCRPLLKTKKTSEKVVLRKSEKEKENS